MENNFQTIKDSMLAKINGDKRFLWILGVSFVLLLCFYGYNHYYGMAQNDISLQGAENAGLQIFTLKSSSSPNSCGHAVIALEGKELNLEEVKLLQDPNVGGVILYNKNFQNKSQFKTLIKNIRSLRKNIQVVADQELSKIAIEAGCDLIILSKRSKKELKKTLEQLSYSANHKSRKDPNSAAAERLSHRKS